MTNSRLDDDANVDSIDLQKLIFLLRKWVWMLLLITVLSGFTAFLVSKKLTPYYESSTILLINEAPTTTAINYNSVLMSEQLTVTYSRMIDKTSLLSKVINQLGLTTTTEALSNLVTITSLKDTQLIQIHVETSNPQLSASIANAIADIFSQHVSEIQSQRFALTRTNLEQQLTEIEAQITSDEIQLRSVISQSVGDKLKAKIARNQEIYSNLLKSYESVRLSEAQSATNVMQVEKAIVNSRPVRPNVTHNVVIAGLAGILLALGAIVIFEVLDDTVKTPDDINRKFRIPVLGAINHQKGIQQSPIAQLEPCSFTADEYRRLRTNLNYACNDRMLGTLMVTSPEPCEGKTTTAVNLAIIFAQSGKQVILADCDFRHPTTQIAFQLNNREGMSTLFTRSSSGIAGIPQSSGVENLWIVTTGQLSPNQSELLGHEKMTDILHAMQEQVDIVIIDTSPVLAVTDAAMLAPSVDGVLIVVKPGKTKTKDLADTVEQLSRVKAHILGVVLNDIDTTRSTAKYYYRYHHNQKDQRNNYYKAKRITELSITYQFRDKRKV